MAVSAGRVKAAIGQLGAAKSLITPKEQWCQDFYALTERGTVVSISSSEAQKFCAIGALGRIRGIEGDDVRRENSLAFQLLLKAAQEQGRDDPAAVNNLGTHEDVMKMFDRAIQLGRYRLKMQRADEPPLNNDLPSTDS